MAGRTNKTSKENQTLELDKRLHRIEVVLGYNEDGTKTGNGLANKITELKEEVKTLKDDIKNLSSYIDNLSGDFIKTDLKMEKAESALGTLLTEINENSKETKAELKNMNEKLKECITTEMLGKIQKTVVGLAGFITALATIAGAVIYFVRHSS